MNKYLYVDSEGRVCRIDADTGAMIPVEWNQPDADRSLNNYETALAELSKFMPRGTNCGPLAVGPKGPSGIPGPRTEARPIFEVIVGNILSPSHVYRIWADGRTEGFGDADVNIRNLIPLAISAARGIAPVAA